MIHSYVLGVACFFVYINILDLIIPFVTSVIVMVTDSVSDLVFCLLIDIVAKMFAGSSQHWVHG